MQLLPVQSFTMIEILHKEGSNQIIIVVVYLHNDLHNPGDCFNSKPHYFTHISVLYKTANYSCLSLTFQ